MQDPFKGAEATGVVPGGEAVSTLPVPVEIPEYYTGFAKEFGQFGADYQSALTRLQTAESKLNQPSVMYTVPEGFLRMGMRMSPLAYIIESLMPTGVKKEIKEAATVEAQAEFDAASRELQSISWKLEVMQTLPLYISDPFYEIGSAEDVLKFISPSLELTDNERAWLSATYDKLSPLTNVLPEGYKGDVLDAQSTILNEILTSPKLELRGVHHLTIDEIAKSFMFGVAKLPPGMTEEDVRSMLSEMEITDEGLQSQRDWLEQRAKDWGIESARMNLIKAGAILAETPELAPSEWAKLIVTQPMMATVELMQKWWDNISRPISAALIMNLPAPAAGAAHGVALGAAVGATAGSIIPGLGTAIGAGVGALVGLIGGAALFAAYEDDADKELTKHYEFYREQGEGAWSSYAKAFNDWDAPWWKKMILDSAYDPMMWLGWGGVAAVGRKLSTAALPRGLKWAGTRIGTMMVALEQGYCSGMDAIFKAGVQVVAAPIKSAFWLTGAGYTIPKTLTQMSRNFARKSLMDFKAVLDRAFPSVKNLGGLTAKDITDTAEACIKAAITRPMEGNDLMVRAGANLLEFGYLDDIAISKMLKDVAGDILVDTSRMARINTLILDSFSGQGERITAGKIISELGREATEESVTNLAAKITKFKDSIVKKSISSIKGTTPKEMLMSIFNKSEATRYANLHSPLTQYMQQAGRSASWHSRVADRILYSSAVVSLERRLVMPIARWQLLFFNFGPWNYAENMMRSYLGGAEIMHPKAYGGVAETNRLFRGLSNAPYEDILFERGQVRLTQAFIDPQTGTTAVFKGGKVPFITRDVVIPEKIPFMGGKNLGIKMNIGGKQFYIGSFQDIYDMWAYLGANQVAYDQQVHFLKALQEIAPDDMKAIGDIIDATKPMLDDIASITKHDANDIVRELRLEIIGGGPESVRQFSDIDVLTFQRRHISNEINKVMDNLTDIHAVTKIGIRDEILDGKMFVRGTDGIDDRMAAWLASEREMNIASLANQIDALQQEAKLFASNPPRNMDDFLGDMQNITSHVEAVGETIHDYRRITELRKVKLNPADFDNFEVGSAKMLSQYMDTAEENLTKLLNQLKDNARLVGLDKTQLARLSDLESITRLELDNILSTRTKIAEVEAIIPTTPKKLRNDRFWLQQRAQKSAIWDEYDSLSRRLKSMRLSSSRNFLLSVDKPFYVPDFVPEVVGELTPNHLAYLYGVTGDDLYRGLTRVQHNITVRPREDFILHTKDQANAYAAKLGKTAEQLGFTDEAIGEVYDQMWRSLGINPNILTPDSPTALQLEEIRQELYRMYASSKIPESDVIKWRQYINRVADDVWNLDVYKGAMAVPELELKAITTDVGEGFEIFSKGKSVGTISYGTTEGLGIKNGMMIGRIEIAESARRQGFATQAIDRLLSDAESRGLTLYTGILEPDGVKLFNALESKGIIRLTRAKHTMLGLTVTRGKATVPPIAPVRAGVSGTPAWWSAKETAMTQAREMHKLAYPTYDDANIIDETMRALFPFWNYELFRWKWLPRTFMRTPGTLSGVARYINYTDSGYTPVPGTDLQLNILRGSIFMGGLRSFYLRDFPEYHDAIPGIEFLDYIGRAGFFPGIHVMGPIVGISALASGTKLQWGELAPAWVKTGLSALRALSPEHIGNILDIIYPDRFRDYLTMMELASMGYDGDEIWNKKQQGQKLTEEEEKLWLQAVNKVDGVKGILMNQTGLFRIRPQEFATLRNEMRLAIEEATGVPVATQEWIDKMYPVTGKRFTDYFHLDIQQQSLLYQWESYRRYQNITTPLYPSSWQALDIKISEYYNELEKVYNNARYNGIYKDGELIQPSIMELNRQLVEGIIGPDQWRAQRSNIQQGLSEAARVLGESAAYVDVPKSFEERAKLLEERGIVTPTQTPDQELLYYYYELTPELKYNWESDRMELDYDTYYAYIDALLESLSPTQKERFLQRVQNDWTPMEVLYWNFSRTYARPYRNLRSIVLNEYTDEERQQIRRFEVATGAEHNALLEVVGSDGMKLISGFQKKLREARMRLRMLDPELDAWLSFFGTTTNLLSTKSKEIYNNLREQYLTSSMIGEIR